MTERLDECLTFLRGMNAEKLDHSTLGLLSHLLGTRRLLQQWGARPTLCAAGLFHSVYGTEGYPTPTVPAALRERVRELIGDEAEALVWLFCCQNRRTLGDNLNRTAAFAIKHRLSGEDLPLTQQQFNDLVNLTFANELEAYPRMSRTWRKGCRCYLSGLNPAAMSAACEAFDGCCPQWWQFWK